MFSKEEESVSLAQWIKTWHKQCLLPATDWVLYPLNSSHPDFGSGFSAWKDSSDTLVAPAKKLQLYLLSLHKYLQKRPAVNSTPLSVQKPPSSPSPFALK